MQRYEKKLNYARGNGVIFSQFQAISCTFGQSQSKTVRGWGKGCNFAEEKIIERKLEELENLSDLQIFV